MKLTPIEVESYSGHKADEKPRRFKYESHWVEVVEVVDCWHQVENFPEWPQADYFKVRASDDHNYLLKHDLESGIWFLGQRW